MSGQQHKEQKTIRREQLHYWNQQVDFQVNQQVEAQEEQTGVVFTLSQAARQLLKEVGSKDKQKILLLERFIEQLTGKRVKLILLKDEEFTASVKEEQLPELPTDHRAKADASGGSPAQGWGLVYNLHEEYSEQEQTTFRAVGVVATADGKEIKFDVSFNLSRSFQSQTDINLRAGDALTDPLVVNFGVTSVSVSQDKMPFDINADGTLEQISQLNPGTGFLVVDHNQDNIVNDGRELFGPLSGNGFAEFAGYDADHNGWIDEKDSIFEKLRVWAQDGLGNSQLLTLAQAGVGAIYLDHAATPFALKDTQNQLLGQIRRSGVYLSTDAFNKSTFRTLNNKLHTTLL